MCGFNVYGHWAFFIILFSLLINSYHGQALVVGSMLINTANVIASFMSTAVSCCVVSSDICDHCCMHTRMHTPFSQSPLLLILSILTGLAKLFMSSLTHSHWLFFEHSLCLVPSVSIVVHHLTQSSSSLRSTCPSHCSLSL